MKASVHHTLSLRSNWYWIPTMTYIESLTIGPLWFGQVNVWSQRDTKIYSRCGLRGQGARSMIAQDTSRSHWGSSVASHFNLPLYRASRAPRDPSASICVPQLDFTHTCVLPTAPHTLEGDAKL
ncbi:hypothetical protein K466DRAFT_338020 [Polyporus arcularius HHB13444]|uniref:Uncharacterized protein n=1 Tax=Polyporus arcularius HHB13444 TaxID=1314778 RepID=A0A5C3PS46_9APHY|nr:hypothetical protein K466DRAFT_338020 [Polyporus arcularius HHB13444]